MVNNPKIISFVVYGEPVAKGRARTVFNKKVGRVLSYTPDKTTAAENAVRAMVLGIQAFDRDIPLELEITSFKTRPKSAKKSQVYPTTRPDFDNYAKLVCDAIEKFAYADDAQIVDATIKKRYGSPPRTEVTIKAKGEVDNER